MTQENNILVSVLMTAYNRQDFIPDAIGSVLASTYTNFELIISDDGSTDNTVRIAMTFAAKDSRIRVFVNKENMGDYPNRNIAAKYANGKYLKYLDSDDTIAPDGLEKMVEAVEKFPNAAFGITQFNFDPNIVYPQLISPQEAYTLHFKGSQFLSYGPVGTIIRKDIFERMNGFSPQRYISDTEMWLKLSATYPVVKIEPGVVEWRKHPNQEFILGMNSYSYLRLAYPVYMKSLLSEQCPLSQEDKDKIIRRLQWKHSRDILSLAFVKGKPLLALTIYREADFGLSQLVKGLLTYKRVKEGF